MTWNQTKAHEFSQYVVEDIYVICLVVQELCDIGGCGSDNLTILQKSHGADKIKKIFLMYIQYILLCYLLHLPRPILKY